MCCLSEHQVDTDAIHFADDGRAAVRSILPLKGASGQPVHADSKARGLSLHGWTLNYGRILDRNIDENKETDALVRDGASRELSIAAGEMDTKFYRQ